MTASGRKRTLIPAVFRVPEHPLSGKADIPLLFCSGVTSMVTTILTLNGFAPAFGLATAMVEE